MEAERWMTIGELARDAGVTPRTVRYYVAEGLLPAPEHYGRQAVYTLRHLLLVRAIRAMRAEDLPLRKIALVLASSTEEALEQIARRPQGAAEPMYVQEPTMEYDRPATPSAERPPGGRELLAYLLERPGRRRLEETLQWRAARERGGPEEPVWRRLEIGEGVELHFTAGGDPEREALIRAAAEALRARLRRLRQPEG
ncbi:MAG TPA: MerR family transcriptional regulator [Chthonomonadales bacterium]|nr:MerR family transcriptional regulator [Chthonomonadales bacterium]